MPFANLTIDLNANLSKLQGDLDKAATLSQQAAAKIQKSADGAGLALGNAANAADFGALSKDAAAAAGSMDQLKDSASGTGTAIDKAKQQLKGLLSTIQTEAATQFDKLQEKGKVAGAVISVAIGALLAGTIAGAVYGAYKVIKETSGFIAGLFTGESYKSPNIDALIAANETVKELQHSLAITATAASVLDLALRNINVPKGDFVEVYTATEQAIRKVIEKQEQLNAVLAGAKQGGNVEDIQKAQTAVQSNVSAFDRLGVAYKDAGGKLLDFQTVVQNADKVLASYTAGYDRNAAAAELGIGAADKVAAAAKLNAANYKEAGDRLADYHLVIGPRTQEAVAQYEKAMRDFRTESDLTAEGFKRAIADAIMPTLTGLADYFKEGFPNAVSIFRGVLAGLVTILEAWKVSVFAVTEPVIATFAAMSIGVVASLEAIQKALRLDFKGALQDLSAGAADIKARYAEIPDAIRKVAEQSRANIRLALGQDSNADTNARDKLLARPAGGKAYVPPPSAVVTTPKTTSSAPVVDLQKKILEQQLKVLEVYIAEEKDRLALRDGFLQLYYQNDEVSISDYFSFRANALRENVEHTRAAYAEEIADIEKYIKTVDRKNDPRGESKVVEAETRIIDVRSKLAKLESDASTETLKDWFAQRKAVEQYGDQLSALSSQIKMMKGDSAGAFAIDFDIQNRSLSKKLMLGKASDDPAVRDRAAQGEAELAELRRQGLARAQLNDLDRQRGDILGSLQNQQERISIAVASGASTEMEGLAAASRANAERVASLAKVVDAYEAIAKASGDPSAIVQADALRVQLERLASQTDLVADKFRAIGTDAFASFFEKIASGTVKVKDAFKSLFADLTAQINKIAARNIAESLFGKDGGLKDFGSILSKFLGGGAQSDSAKPSGSGTSGSGIIGSLLSSFFGKGKGDGPNPVDAGASDQTKSQGIAANDAAFTALTGTVSAAQTALMNFSTQGVGGAASSFSDYIQKTIFGTVAETAANDATTSAALSLGVMSTAADAAATALFKVAATSAVGGGGGSGSDLMGAFIKTLGSADGNIFSAGNLVPFASGGIVSRPTVFPMRNGGMGLMGEAGPEAILPLRRTRDGRLGVAADGSSGNERRFVQEINLHYYPAPGETRATTAQRGATLFRQGQLAANRNG